MRIGLPAWRPMSPMPRRNAATKTIDEGTASAGGPPVAKVDRAPKWIESGDKQIGVPANRTTLLIKPSAGTGRATISHAE